MVACQALSVHPNRQTTATDHLPLSAACRRHHADEGRVVVSMLILDRQHVPFAVVLYSIMYPDRKSNRAVFNDFKSTLPNLFTRKHSTLFSTNCSCAILRLLLLLFHSNYGRISYLFRDRERYLQKKSHPLYLTPLLRGFPWNFVMVVGLKN